MMLQGATSTMEIIRASYPEVPTVALATAAAITEQQQQQQHKQCCAVKESVVMDQCDVYACIDESAHVCVHTISAHWHLD
jgi:hypothetical protein